MISGGPDWVHCSGLGRLFLSPSIAILFRVSTYDDLDSQVLVDEHQDIKEPQEYRVILLNDDFTTMEFVVAVLVSVFHKNLMDATRIMLDVHKKGRGLVGVYSYDIAVTKINRVHSMARENGFPLKCVMEKV